MTAKQMPDIRSQLKQVESFSFDATKVTKWVESLERFALLQKNSEPRIIDNVAFERDMNAIGREELYRFIGGSKDQRRQFKKQAVAGKKLVAELQNVLSKLTENEVPYLNLRAKHELAFSKGDLTGENRSIEDYQEKLDDFSSAFDCLAMKTDTDNVDIAKFNRLVCVRKLCLLVYKYTGRMPAGPKDDIKPSPAFKFIKESLKVIVDFACEQKFVDRKNVKQLSSNSNVSDIVNEAKNAFKKLMITFWI